MTDETFNAYFVSHEAYYHSVLAHAYPDLNPREIMVSRAHDDGSCVFEFGIREHVMLNSQPYVRVEVFSDSFDAFGVMPELFQGLIALGEDATIENVQELLDNLGYRDITKRKDLYA